MNAEPDYHTKEISASFPSIATMVSPIRNFAGEIVRDFGHASLQTKVEVCVEEIVTNIMRKPPALRVRTNDDRGWLSQCSWFLVFV